MEYTDDEIVDALREIDESDDIEVSGWEGEFLDTIKKMPKPRRLTPKQRQAAVAMIERYLEDDDDCDDDEEDER